MRGDRKDVAQDVAQDVARDVAHDVPQDVPQYSKEEIEKIILEEVRQNKKITRKELAEKIGVSAKTISRYIKDMENIEFTGTGRHGNWEIKEIN
ncbi:MAG TPA: helix-turn-helix transcriptional regulator [Clostridiaceae bacterium]|nr:helix-turn-helix transcriptional regulator [Clostridiaceae bacterium]